MSMEPELVTLLRQRVLDDGGGGETETWQEVGKWQASVHFYRKQSWDREEEGKHNTQGPGIETVVRRLFLFREEWETSPAVEINDRLKRPDGTVWVAQMVRPYDESLQVDAELVT